MIAATSPYGTQADLARRLGVNRSTIHRALAAGRLVPAGDATAAAHGLLDIEASVARYAATRGHRVDLVDRHAAHRAPAPGTPASLPAASAHQDAHQATGAPSPSSQPTQAPAAAPWPAPAAADGTAFAGATGQDRAAVKGAILAAENAKTKIEIALRRGLRLLLADVGRECHGLGARLQDHLNRVVDQLAARLAAVPDPVERARILHPELHRVSRAFDAGLIEALRAVQASPAPRRGEGEGDGWPGSCAARDAGQSGTGRRR